MRFRHFWIIAFTVTICVHGGLHAQDNVPTSQFIDIPTPAGQIDAWSMTDDGEYLITAPKDKTIRLWDFVEGTQATVLTEKNEAIARITAMGIGQALAQTESGRLLLIEPRWRRADKVADGVINLATAARGNFVALVRKSRNGGDQIDLHLLANGISPNVQSTVEVKEGVKAIALMSGGEQLAVADNTHHLRRYDRAGTVLQDRALTSGVQKMEFNIAETALVVLTDDHRLLLVPANASKGSDAECELARGVAITSFQMRKSPLLANGVPATGTDIAAPQLLAVSAGHEVFGWHKLECPVPGTDGPDERFVIAQGSNISDVAFDYLASPHFRTILAMDGESGFIQILALGDLARPSRKLATLISVEGAGWLIYDEFARYDGSQRSLAGLEGARRYHRTYAKGIPLDRFDTCWRPHLLQTVRATAPIPQGICDSADSAQPLISIATRRIPPSDPSIVHDDPTPIYEAVVSVRSDIAVGAGPPRLIHQTREVGKLASTPCDQPDPTWKCWKTRVDAIPGATNTLIALWPVGDANLVARYSFKADRLAKGQERKPVLHIVLLSVSDYGAPVGEKCDPAMQLCDLSSPKRTAQALHDAINTAASHSRAIDIHYLTLPELDSSGTALDRNQYASQAYFSEALKKLATYPEDVVWIILNGHAAMASGIYSRDSIGAQADKGFSDFVFLPPAAGGKVREETDRWLAQSREKDGIPPLTGQALAAAMTGLRARYLMLTVDTCSADGASKSLQEALANDFEQGAPLGVELLLAVAQNQQALDSGSDTLMDITVARLKDILATSEPVLGNAFFGSIFEKLSTTVSSARYQPKWSSVGTDIPIFTTR